MVQSNTALLGSPESAENQSRLAPGASPLTYTQLTHGGAAADVEQQLAVLDRLALEMAQERRAMLTQHTLTFNQARTELEGQVFAALSHPNGRAEMESIDHPLVREALSFVVSNRAGHTTM